MFEKETEEYVRNNWDKNVTELKNDRTYQYVKGSPHFYDSAIRQAWQKGATFGYNKANEWHNINDIEPSKEQFGKQLLIRIESVIGDTDYDYLVYKYKGESISDIAGVVAWKEIK